MELKNVILMGTLVTAGIVSTIPQSKAQIFNPDIHGSIIFELQNDWAFDSDDSDADVNTLTTTIEPFFVLSLTDRLALETLFVVEQVQSPDANDDTIL